MLKDSNYDLGSNQISRFSPNRIPGSASGWVCWEKLVSIAVEFGSDQHLAFEGQVPADLIFQKIYIFEQSECV